MRPSLALSKVTYLRLTESEHAAFITAAKGLRETRSHLLRLAVREYINQPVDVLDKELPAFYEAVYQLRAVGRNLNQITKAMHLGERADIQLNMTILETLKQTVNELDARLVEVVKKSRVRRVYRK